ncbi:DUF402 domain-containing protein [Halorhabdus sp. CUG00001]|uniref:DUF402 domain-containing protein n=1 Tax=Halorhabdus sp. CUG00001 TaxID=2600297 RepID=UPI00131AC07F|nr:DUF402 domain-containing protein [Halorhabdus sp. CUG00001]
MTATAPFTVQCRGIYATALTDLLVADERFAVGWPSGPIARRFDVDFETAPPDASIVPDDDRLGVGVLGDEAAVGAVVDRLRVATDTLTWVDSTPRGAVFDGVVTDTLGSGALVDLGDDEAFLPYGATAAHVETDDRVRVQIDRPVGPWSDARPEVTTQFSIRGALASLVREESTATSGPDLLDVLSVEIPDGWRVSWDREADEAEFAVLEAALEPLLDRAEDLDRALAEADDRTRTGQVFPGESTTWVQFGRASRFELDSRRRAVTPTMPGHHRIKAGAEQASAAVDFVEALAPDFEGSFPFDVVTRQFGPTVGDRVRIAHGKPDGRTISLGRGEVTDRDPDGTVRVEREMSPGGTYDGLGIERQAGDVAVTKLTEGKWWYPTVYRGNDGQKRGTYVNICTPVEVFPDEVRYVDLHVDVVKHADGTVERVDDDELDAAVEAGHVPEALAAKARDVASAVENAL